GAALANDDLTIFHRLTMHISDFDYDLPTELIAREPVRPRDASRMMVIDRETGQWIDSQFCKLPDFLRPTDVLVLHDTRVIPARVVGTLERKDGSTREVEVLFAAPAKEGAWAVLCRPGRRIRNGDRIRFADGEFEGIFAEPQKDGLRILHV